MPRTNSSNWSVNDQLSAVRMQDLNEDIDDLYSNGSDRLRAWVTTGLNIQIGAGNYRIGSTEGLYAGGTVAMTNNATNYVMIDSSGVIQVSTSSWNTNYAKIAIVVASGGVITSVTNRRIDAIGGVIGGTSFKNITSTTYTKGLLTAFTADGTSYTLTYNFRGQVATMTNGANTWTMTYNARGDLTGTVES